MAKRAFDLMMEGLEDAVAYVEGDASRGVVHTPIDIKALRQRVKQTQAEFAATYRLPLGTLRDWEQGRRQPDAPARVLLELIDKEPDVVAKTLARG